MSNNYLKVGKLYSLSSTTDVSISGSSFIHAIVSNHNNTATVTIDGIALSISSYSYLNFNVPIAFSAIKTSAGTMTIVYS